MSNFMEWAKSELERIGAKDEPMQQEINRNILEILEVFDQQCHSGFSANYAIAHITRLLDWKPITPLTGEDDEWAAPFDDSNTQQNKRCSAVFRTNFDNSTARYINGRVFSDDGGKTWFDTRDSSVPVTFPFIVPLKPEYVILADADGRPQKSEFQKKVELIASICHEVNRTYCQSIGDNSQLNWADAPDWQRESAIAGVIFHLENEASPEDTHVNWMNDKIAAGWVYGAVKDPELKTHPCIVPYNELPVEQRTKDHLFKAVCDTAKGWLK